MIRSEKIVLAILVFISSSYILSSAYLGINGHHAWRQAEVYGHILGFLHVDGFSEFDRFRIDQKAVYDIPVYQFLIALLSSTLECDPLVVTRYLNTILWFITAYFGYRLVELLAEPISGVVFIFLFATSPLILHYYSAPLPDLMAIALSVSALSVLIEKGNTWQTMAIVTPLLIIATLIKSPIPFVFLALYCTYVSLTLDFRNEALLGILKKHLVMIITLIILLCSALLAEQIRYFLTGEYSSKFIPPSSWYFGTWKLRASKEFWLIVQSRLNSAGPFNFSLLYILLLITTATKLREKRYRAITISCVVSFFSGWLVFSNVYYIHDYYQLPVAITIFFSTAISFSVFVNLATHLLSAKNKVKWHGFIVAGLAPLAIHLALTQVSFSDRSRAPIYSIFEHGLKNQTVFLRVDNANPDEPTLGGQVGHRFKWVSSEEFEQNCDRYLSEFDGVVVRGFSMCLFKNKQLADYYVEDGNYIFYMNNRLPAKARKVISGTKALFEGYFHLYVDHRQLIYFKQNCALSDLEPRFYLHVVPEHERDLPVNAQNDFGNYDFFFLEYGKYRDGDCVAVRKLPNYDIRYIRTGQFSGPNIIWGANISRSELDLHIKNTIETSENAGKKAWLNNPRF